MNIKAMKFLRDIQRAGGLVAQFTAGKSRADYQGDVLLRSGVERQLGIIGEALTQPLHLEPEI